MQTFQPRQALACTDPQADFAMCRHPHADCMRTEGCHCVYRHQQETFDMPDVDLAASLDPAMELLGSDGYRSRSSDGKRSGDLGSDAGPDLPGALLDTCNGTCPAGCLSLPEGFMVCVAAPAEPPRLQAGMKLWFQRCLQAAAGWR